MSVNASHQQHLRTLRRSLNRAVTAIKSEGRVVLHTGWAYGRAFGHARLSGQADVPWPDEEELYLLFPEPEEGQGLWHTYQHLIASELLLALDFFWPGPLVVEVRCSDTRRRLKLACPWHPLMKEMLSRNGPCLWSPLTKEESTSLALRGGAAAEVFGGEIALLWPEPEISLSPTYFDASTIPWRLTEVGFIEVEELASRISRPFLLSQERAFPRRSLRTFTPQYQTVVLEAASKEELPALVKQFQESLGVDWSLRIYLEESVAHTHFPDDRRTRVYGEMKDPERVRRRLEAMLERQRRRSGKRVLLIGVAELEPSADSLKSDLQKLADRWLTVPSGGTVQADEFFSR